jgi:hypothetical protein
MTGDKACFDAFLCSDTPIPSRSRDVILAALHKPSCNIVVKHYASAVIRPVKLHL